jgi:hypothetical protein
MQTHDPILKLVLQKENLPATLDILKRAKEIRQAALQTFWDSILSHLKTTTPPRIAKLRDMQWEFWPSHGQSGNQDYELYFLDARFAYTRQHLNHCVRHWMTESSYAIDYGIMWNMEEASASRLWKLPQVEKLRQSLNGEIFKITGSSWWVGRAGLLQEDSVEDFLKKHTANSSQIKLIKQRVSRDFWQLVDDTIDLVSDANHAIQRKHQR